MNGMGNLYANVPATDTVEFTITVGTLCAGPSLVEQGELQHIVKGGRFLCGQENGWSGGTIETPNCLGCLMAYDPRPWYRRLRENG